jgi:hypothetical protein
MKKYKDIPNNATFNYIPFASKQSFVQIEDDMEIDSEIKANY